MRDVATCLATLGAIVALAIASALLGGCEQSGDCAMACRSVGMQMESFERSGGCERSNCWCSRPPDGEAK